MKITPQAALDAAKVLWPKTVSITASRDEDAFFTAGENDTTIAHIHNTVGIDWPDGVFKWPVVEKWRVPTDEDARQRKPCRVRDSENHGWSLQIRTLLAVLPGGSHRFVTYLDATGILLAHWQRCEVEDKPEAAAQPPKVSDDDALITVDWLLSNYCSEHVDGRFFYRGLMFKRGTDGYWDAYSAKTSHTHFLCRPQTRKEFRDLINVLGVDKTS